VRLHATRQHRRSVHGKLLRNAVNHLLMMRGVRHEDICIRAGWATQAINRTRVQHYSQFRLVPQNFEWCTWHWFSILNNALRTSKNDLLADEPEGRVRASFHSRSMKKGIIQDYAMARNAGNIRLVSALLCWRFTFEENSLIENVNRSIRKIYGNFRCLF
jgi:hypothetical protein